MLLVIFLNRFPQITIGIALMITKSSTPIDINTLWIDMAFIHGSHTNENDHSQRIVDDRHSHHALQHHVGIGIDQILHAQISTAASAKPYETKIEVGGDPVPVIQDAGAKHP